MSTTQHQAMKRARDFLATYAPPEWADAETLVAMLYAARIERLEKALNRIASWDDGPAVGPNFDEPASAEIARAALEDPVPQFPGAPGAQRAAPAVLEALEELIAEFGVCGLTEMARAAVEQHYKLHDSPAAPSAPTAKDEPFARPHSGAGDARGEGR